MLSFIIDHCLYHDMFVILCVAKFYVVGCEIILLIVQLFMI